MSRLIADGFVRIAPVEEWGQLALLLEGRLTYQYGAFAVREIPAGTLVSKFLTKPGPFHLVNGTRVLPDPWEKVAYQVGVNTWKAPDAVGWYVNHVCGTPNCRATDEGLFSIRPIIPGEELQTDYATHEDHDQVYFPVCYCLSPECRGVDAAGRRRPIRGFQSLPEETARRYYHEGILAPWIVRVYNLEQRFGAQGRP